MPDAGGFWSYVHADDLADGGRIARLARDVVAQYEMMTAEQIPLFLDRDELKWGDEWRPKVDAALDSILFFVPVLTPRYFRSVECRREFNFFVRKADSLGIRELIMPILYITVPAFDLDNQNDEMVTLAKSFQWEDWRELRFSALDSPEYRRAVARMAERLAVANAAVEGITVVPTEAEGVDGSAPDSDEPGYLDLVARAEEVMPVWNETLLQIAAEVEKVGGVMQRGVEDLAASDTAGKGFAGRLNVIRNVTSELEEPAERVEELSNRFSAQLADVDSGVRVLLARLPEELEQNPQNAADAYAFVSSIRHVSNVTDESLSQMQKLIDSIGQIESSSRGLRPVLRRLRQSLTLLLEAREVTRGWVRLSESFPGEELEAS